MVECFNGTICTYENLIFSLVYSKMISRSLVSIVSFFGILKKDEKVAQVANYRLTQR